MADFFLNKEQMGDENRSFLEEISDKCQNMDQAADCSDKLLSGRNESGKRSTNKMKYRREAEFQYSTKGPLLQTTQNFIFSQAIAIGPRSSQRCDRVSHLGISRSDQITGRARSAFFSAVYDEFQSDGDLQKIIGIQKVYMSRVPCQAKKIKSDSMSGEEDNIRFDVRRGREHGIRCEKKKIISDSMPEEEDNIGFDARRER
jgi:hypothetical protein